MCRENGKVSRGDNRTIRKKSRIEQLEINLPSIEEQKKIEKKLSKVFSLIALCKQQLAKLDELVKARFVEMFGTETEFQKWNHVTVGEVAEVCVGVVIKPTQYYAPEGVPAFRSLNIGEMYVKDADWVYFTEEGHQKNQKSVIRENDVLVVRSGAPGTACVATKKYAGYNAVDIIIAHPHPAKVNSCFLAAFINMPHGMNQIKEKTGGAAQQHFNVRGYKELKLILPPMELQTQFAAFVQSTDQVKSTVQASLDELETLKKSLMQEYFG
ncbi:MAG: restriction endonuclease subunit S [Oscillospiraceae bacterium]|nr:restriction endonuclease subunit S [Oscillospiraceae bacterium]